MKKFYVVYEVDRDIYIATRKPKSGISFVQFVTMQSAKLFRNKITKGRSRA